MRPRAVLIGLLLSLASLSSPSAGAEEARLVLLHTTDLHGALTDFDYLSDLPAARGLVRIASLVAAARRESVFTLLVDAGGGLHGSPLVTVHAGDPSLPEPMTTAMNRLGYDAMAVGTDEFLRGGNTLERARSNARFPWLAANLVRETDGKPAFAASVVRKAGPLRIGVVGVCAPPARASADSARFAGLRFGSPVDAARAEVERLRGAGRCDLVVLLAHTGFEPNPASGIEGGGYAPDEPWGRRLAGEVKGVDVVVLGRTHAVIGAVEVAGALVTQAGRDGEHLGRVDLTLTRAAAGERWRVTSRRATVIPVADSVAADPALAALAEPYHRATREALARVVARADRELGSPLGRLGDGPIWELIHRVQLEASGAEVSLAALSDPSARLGPGAVTERDLMRVLPHDDPPGVIEITGAELKQTLEHAARSFDGYTFEAGRPLAPPGLPGGSFVSAEGVSYEIDLTRPAGDRIRGLAFQGAALAPERRLRAALDGRLLDGGGLEVLRRAPRLWRSERGARELLIEHARRSGALATGFGANWSLLPDYATTPERSAIDLLVRRGVLRRDEVVRLAPEDPALRGDVVFWIARALGWRERRLSGAFSDVPDTLAPWLDGLLKRRVLGERAAHDRFEPYGIALRPVALDWCERAARAAGYAIARGYDREFRDGLTTGLGAGRGDTLTRAQALRLVANLRYPTVRILETTDFHGAILSTARERRTRRAIGGSPVLAAHVERLRAENPAGTVLLDGGDCFQGTMISNLQFGRPVVEQMNALGYSAMAIGNHEFDWSADTLARRIHGMRFAALGANLRERKSGRRPGWARTDTVVTRRGVRVGVLGLCYRFTPSVTLARHVRHLEFEDDSAAAARLVPRLRSRSDVVVAVGHVPAQADSGRRARSGDLVRLARGVRGVDAWFGGHSHNQIDDRIAGVPLMIAGSHGQVVAVCDLVVDPLADQVVESSTRLVTTYADEVVPDSAMQARVERWNAEVAPIAATPLGRNLRTLTRDRGAESTIGDLVTDAIRAAAGVDIALQNSGGLRADLPEGTITRGHVYEVMPFDNLIMTMELTGTEVRRAIEEGLATDRVTQVSGIRYRFDLSRPQGERLVSITDMAGNPLGDETVYRVACNDFMATGGDEYAVLANGRNRTDTGILVREALEAHIAARREGLDVTPDGRIERLGGGSSRR